MSAGEHIRLAERFVDCTNQRDWDAMATLISEDFEWHTAISEHTVSRVIRGLPAFRSWWETEIAEALDLEASHEEIEEITDAGDAVVAIVRSVDVGRASGAVVESRSGCVWTLAEGRLTSLRVFVEPREAFRAVGLDPPSEDAQPR